MAVGKFYQIESVDAGPPIVGRFLGSYLNTIKGMNDAAMAFEAQDDESAGDLGKMELAARERLTKMTEALQDAKSGDYRSANDLMQTLMERGSVEKVEAGKLSAEMARSARDVELALMEQAQKQNEQFEKDITLDPESQRTISNNAWVAQDPRNASAVASSIRDNFLTIAATEGAGDARSPKYRKMMSDLYTSLMANGDAKSKAVAEALAADLLPEAGRQGMTPPDFFEAQRPMTMQDARMEAERIVREHRGGMGKGGGVYGAVEAAGMTPRDLRSEGRSESTSTSTKGGAGATPGGGGRAPADVSVKMEGFSPDAARAFAAAPDVYAGLQAAIDAQSRYADELAQRAQEARGRKRSLYPRPNVYTVTPNQMATQRWQEAVYNVGNRDYPARPQRDVVFEAATDEENPAQARDWKGQTPEKGPEVATSPTMEMPPAPTREDLDAIYGYTPGPVEKFASMRPKGAADADPMYDFDTFLSEPTAKKEPDPMADFDAFLE